MTASAPARISFEGQVVVVTGAGRGLGRAYAGLIARRGGTVIVHDAGVDMDGRHANPTVAANASAEIRELGGDAHPLDQDLATRNGCETLVDRVLARFGRLDALVHSAGLVAFSSLTDTPADQLERLLAVNVASAVWLSRASLPAMTRQSYGRVVLTVSATASSAPARRTSPRTRSGKPRRWAS